MADRTDMKDILGYVLTVADMAALRSLVGPPGLKRGDHDLSRLELLGLVETGEGWDEHGRWGYHRPRLTVVGRRVAVEVLKVVA